MVASSAWGGGWFPSGERGALVGIVHVWGGGELLNEKICSARGSNRGILNESVAVGMSMCNFLKNKR